MKNWPESLRLFIGAGLLCFGVVSCEPPQVEKVGGGNNSTESNSDDRGNPFRSVKPGNGGGSDVPATFPVNREIIDVEGRSVPVTLIGRTETEIQFNRISDGKRFDLPMERLSAADRDFVKTLPLFSVPMPVPVVQKPRYIEVREEDIAKMESEIQLKKAELKSRQLDSILETSRRRQISDLEKEIEGLKLDIEVYKRNNKL